MHDSKSGVQNGTVQVNNPYKYPSSSFPQRFPKIDTVSWVIGGTFGILFGLLLPLGLMEVIMNVVSLVIRAIH